MLMILEAMATSRSQGKRHFFFPKISAKIEVNGYYTITIIHISYIYHIYIYIDVLLIILYMLMPSYIVLVLSIYIIYIICNIYQH